MPESANNKKSYRLIWCHERSHKEDSKPVRDALHQAARDLGASLTYFRKATQFSSYIHRTSRLPYILITNLREARPCLDAVAPPQNGETQTQAFQGEDPLSGGAPLEKTTRPLLTVVLLDSQKQLVKATNWQKQLEPKLGPVHLCVFEPTTLQDAVDGALSAAAAEEQNRICLEQDAKLRGLIHEAIIQELQPQAGQQQQQQQQQLPPASASPAPGLGSGSEASASKGGAGGEDATFSDCGSGSTMAPSECDDPDRCHQEGVDLLDDFKHFQAPMHRLPPGVWGGSAKKTITTAPTTFPRPPPGLTYPHEAASENHGEPAISRKSTFEDPKLMGNGDVYNVLRAQARWIL